MDLSREVSNKIVFLHLKGYIELESILALPHTNNIVEQFIIFVQRSLASTSQCICQFPIHIPSGISTSFHSLNRVLLLFSLFLFICFHVELACVCVCVCGARCVYMCSDFHSYDWAIFGNEEISALSISYYFVIQ